MKYVGLFIGAALVLASSASAQEEAAVGSVSEASAPTEPAPIPKETASPEEEKRSVYYKKTQGWLWMEAFAGPSAYDPDQFTTLAISGAAQDLPKVNGPEYGFAAGLGLGGFWLGAFYRQANYSAFKLMKVGLDIQGIFRFIPYVHPMVRIDLFYSKTFGGDPYGLTNIDVDGGGLTVGVGLRVPIIRWISFAATFDWSMIALAIRGTDSSGERDKGAVLGQQLGATFALTFHFFGVRRN